MKKTFNKALALCVALVVLLGFAALLPASASALGATSNLTVNGIAVVTAGAATGNPVMGADYDLPSNTLTLDDYNGGAIAAVDMGDLVIYVKNLANTVTTTAADQDAISLSNTALSLEGDTSASSILNLNATGANANGIQSDSNVMVNEVFVQVLSNGSSIVLNNASFALNFTATD